MPEKVLVAEPRGFCAGVEMAIKALTWMVQTFEPPIYCYHEIVHNQAVVEEFEGAGVVFVDDVSGVPPGAPLMLSAHGSGPGVVEAADRRAAVVVDAVCPLVTKVHHEVKRMARQEFDIIYVGHGGHDEAVGTIAEAPDAITLVDPERVEDDPLAGFSPDDAGRVALLAQTTLGMHEWDAVLARARERFPELWTARKSDLCYATTNRQAAVQEMARRADLILVVGSDNSSNTRALVRVAREAGCAAYRIDEPADVRAEWLQGARVVGVTAGASAPEHLVRAVVDAVAPTEGVERLAVTSEDEYFPLPRQLRALLGALQAAVEGGYTVRNPGGGGLLEADRDWGATEALDLLSGTPIPVS